MKMLWAVMLLTGCDAMYTKDYYQDAVTLRVEGSDCNVVFKQDEIRGGPGVSAGNPVATSSMHDDVH